MAKHRSDVDYSTTSVVETDKGVMIIDHGSRKAKKAYVKFLKGKGHNPYLPEKEVPEKKTETETEVEVEAVKPAEPQEVWRLPEEDLNRLRQVGWLRDGKTETEEEEVNPEETMEMDLSPMLAPLGMGATQVWYKTRGKIRAVMMPTIMHGILGNLYLQGAEKPEEVTHQLKKLSGLTPAQAGKEFGYGNWEKYDLLGAIVQSYQKAFDLDETLQKDLLETGADVLQWRTKDGHENIVLGVAKNGRNWEGKNLVGHALMSLRAALGGQPDPRLELVRGMREFTVEEVTPGNSSEYTEAVLNNLAQLQAEMFLGDAPTDSEELVEHLKNQQELKKFILDNNFWPFPMFDEVVLIGNTLGNSFTSPEPLLRWLHKLGSVGVLSFIGAEKSLFGESFLNPVNMVDLGESILPAVEYDRYRDGTKIHLDLTEGGEWWAWYLSEQCAKLNPTDMVKLFTILAHGEDMATAEWSVDNTQVHLTHGTEMYTWNFMFRTVSARQSRKAFATAIINDKPTSSNFVMLWLALKALQGFNGINKVLNELTNFWEREANYGHAWEDDHPTRIVRDNSGAPLEIGVDLISSSGNQGLVVKNGKFSYDLFLKLISTPAYRHDCYVDKNGMKLLAGGGAGAASLTGVKYPEIAELAFEALDAGVNPLLVLSQLFDKERLFQAVMELLSGKKATLIVMEEYGIFATLNDGAKMPKFLNRAQQGASWNEAYAWVLWKGEEFKRKPSKMTVRESYNPDWVAATADDEEALLTWLLS